MCPGLAPAREQMALSPGWHIVSNGDRPRSVSLGDGRRSLPCSLLLVRCSPFALETTFPVELRGVVRQPVPRLFPHHRGRVPAQRHQSLTTTSPSPHPGGSTRPPNRPACALRSPTSEPPAPDTTATAITALAAPRVAELAATGPKSSAGRVATRGALTVQLPATTVRDWLRRARTNSEHVRVVATLATHAFDPLAGPLEPTGSPLGDMIGAIGRAVAALTLRLGVSGAGPWQRAMLLTHAATLAPPARPANAS